MTDEKLNKVCERVYRVMKPIEQLTLIVAVLQNPSYADGFVFDDASKESLLRRVERDIETETLYALLIARLMLGLSQSEASKRYGYSKGMISLMESGRRGGHGDYRKSLKEDLVVVYGLEGAEV